MAHDDAPTQEPGTDSLDAMRVMRAPREVTALVIAWARDEPDRAGEVVFPDGPTVLGRGDAPVAGASRARAIRQRPGDERAAPPLASPRLSREQLRIEPRGERLLVSSIGKAVTRFSGEEVAEREIGPGDTVLVGQELLLVAARRPRRLSIGRAWPREVSFSFGDADPFGWVGESPASWELRDRLAFAARADAHVLLLGASGTGKELAARTIHGLSPRRDRAFVARNAATLPEGLIDAELFGNVKNYPNPGMPERPGLVGEADGGTLFLDEIGEMPIALQAHLLRVLDRGGEYQRLGEPRPRRASLRIVAATNRPRHELKHDLLARFAIVIELPPLDARREDVPLLVRHLLARAAQKSGLAPPSMAVDLLDALVRHGYRLHTRELEQLIWQALSESPAGRVALTPGVRARLDAASADTAATRGPGSPPAMASSDADEGVEPDRAAIEGALARAKGSVTKAARELGLRNRFVLYRLLRKHGIAAPNEPAGE